MTVCYSGRRKLRRLFLNLLWERQQNVSLHSLFGLQVYKIKSWLLNNAAAGLDAVEVGTVEAFQGKEKRVILVSTVRANCRLLDYDAKYGLGFLVDEKVISFLIVNNCST